LELSELKSRLLELLEADVEFRYAVAGRLGILEVLRRLDGIEADIKGLWEEVKGLREDQKKLWESHERLWEELKALREDQRKLWESHGRLWEEVKGLREDQKKLWESHERLRKYVLSGFRDLRASLGVAFEDHAASFLEVMLEEMGHPEAKVEKKHLAYNGEVIEINLFCEKPLVVGEATVSVRSAEEAEGEVEKLLRRVKIVKERYGKPEMIVLSVARATKEAVDTLKALAEKHGVRLILGGEIEEALAI